ncbi:hypothetical protein, partial [Staphylococcus epidermidis]|uniref:hypothetical protein n=1 Tax=Staphylococcus epidermidis TaxID=1282 RepID=UPI001C92BA3D
RFNDQITQQTIRFVIAPPLNPLPTLQHPSLPPQLLFSHQFQHPQFLPQQLQHFNQQPKDILSKITNQTFILP